MCDFVKICERMLCKEGKIEIKYKMTRQGNNEAPKTSLTPSMGIIDCVGEEGALLGLD